MMVCPRRGSDEHRGRPCGDGPFCAVCGRRKLPFVPPAQVRFRVGR